MDKKIDELIDKLGCSIAEAKDIIEQDKIIDKGGRTYFDLSKEEEKQAKKWGNVTTKKPTVYKFEKKKTAKENPTKEGIINIIHTALAESGLEISNLEIVNKGKIITFSLDEKEFKIDLTQKRAAKK